MKTVEELKALRSRLQEKQTKLAADIDAINRVIDRFENAQDGALLPTGPIILGSHTQIAVVRDTLEYMMMAKERLDFTIKDVVKEKDFLTALASAQHGAQNLCAIWNDNITLATMCPDDDEDSQDMQLTKMDEALQIAEGSHSEYGVTMLSLRDRTRNATSLLHIVTHKTSGKALAVGTYTISTALEKALAAQGITYVSRADRDARAVVKSTLDNMAGGKLDKKTHSLLLDAFNYRTMEASERQLYTALLSRKTEANYDKYVVKMAVK